jgi:iron complex outermembrane recepter protein
MTLARVTLLVSFALPTSNAQADPGLPPVDFHIEGGDATTTLTEFSRQAHLQLLFDYNIVKGHTTKPLTGTLDPAAALKQLLANTNLEFDFVNERTLAVTQKPTANSKVAAQPKRDRRRTPLKAPSVASNVGVPVDVVRITGTYLRDEVPVGEEIISADRDAIEATGAATPADFLRTLPQVFGGGPNQDTHIGEEALTNSGLGVGVNLRGLGARSTLVLMNGRRVAPGGTEGEFVDIENIPLSAIERIDILPDSASAMYGADAVGGVVNFVLRDSLDGAETILRGGSGVRGDLQEYLLSQALGYSWDGGHGMLALEFYDRGPLPASDRAYAVSDLAPRGGNFNTNITNPGNLVSPVTGQTWALPAGQDGTHLSAAQLTPGTQNLQNVYNGAEIIPDQKRWTLYGSGRQELNSRMSAFSDVLIGHREATETHNGFGTTFPIPSTNPFYVNPAGIGPIEVAYNFGKDLGPTDVVVGVDTLNATLGVDMDIGSAWSMKAYGSYVREKQNQDTGGQVNFAQLDAALADPSPTTAFNPFGDGSNTNRDTLRKIGTVYHFWLDSQIETVDVTADGPLARIAGVPLKMAVGANWRRELFSTTALAATTTSAGNADLDRTVWSGFSELIAPLFVPEDQVPAVHRLELSAAVRYEDYTHYGSSTSPKYGIVWSPVSGVSLRGSWSRAVRPPTLLDLDENHNASAVLATSIGGGAYTNTLIWSGNNAMVEPERAQSWTAGLDVAPDAVPGLTFDLTYFRTSFTDRIQSTLYTPTVLTDPAYAALVTRNPTAAQIDYVCNHTAFAQGTTAACMSAPVGAIVDLRVRNLARALTDGMDFNAGYQQPLPLGKLTLALSGTWLHNFSQAQLPGEPLTSLLDTQNQPINLRFRASTGWEYRGWGTLIAANFSNGYRDIASNPIRHVDAWTTYDLQLRYDFSDSANHWLHGTRVELNARNVLNSSPPFLNNQVSYIGYDQENSDPYGRLLSLQIRKNW